MTTADELPMFTVLGPKQSLDETLREIDAMTYETMLRLVRCAPLSDPLFHGEPGRHFHAVLKAKRHATPPEERDAISKKIGF